ncbi:MAG: hypothetical protein ACLR1T_04865 [Evtepia gabavorous]
MQKVSELKYERLSMEEFAQEIKEVIHQVKTADSARAVLAARDRCNQLMIRWETAQALSYMRYSINTADAFYLAEKEYYDEVGPRPRIISWNIPGPCWRRRSDRSWRRVDRSFPWCSARLRWS